MTDREIMQRKRKHRARSDGAIGYCLRCMRRLTLCGRPFTANVKCRKCGAINVFDNAQQPTAITTQADEVIHA